VLPENRAAGLSLGGAAARRFQAGKTCRPASPAAQHAAESLTRGVCPPRGECSWGAS
jgi:hypothetical protein